jgi:voltage-gated potassium channel
MRQSGILSSIVEKLGRPLAFGLLFVTAIVIVGTVGFRFVEGFTWLDSLYMTVQTVTTVGYGDLAPQTPAGRLFAIILMLTGVGTALYALTILAQSVVQSGVIAGLQTRRRAKKMKKLEGHYIVCGAGRVGRRISRQLAEQGLPFVVIERDETKLADVEPVGAHLMVGDATSEEVLLDAGVAKARGLASCLPDDAANVYVVLTARGLSANLHIVARAVEEQAEPTLVRAGANRVVAPTIIGSRSMARALLKPAIADFMESIAAESLDLVFEEIAVDAGSPYAGKRIGETKLTRELGLIVVAIRRKDGRLIFNPGPDEAVSDGDLLTVIGRAEAAQAAV